MGRYLRPFMTQEGFCRGFQMVPRFYLEWPGWPELHSNLTHAVHIWLFIWWFRKTVASKVKEQHIELKEKMKDKLFGGGSGYLDGQSYGRIHRHHSSLCGACRSLPSTPLLRIFHVSTLHAISQLYYTTLHAISQLYYIPRCCDNSVKLAIWLVEGHCRWHQDPQ